MKRGMLFGLMFGIALIAAIFAIPALAHSPSSTTDEDGTAITQPTADTWKNMWNACQSGDWDAMIESMDEFHGEGFNGMMSMMMGGFGSDRDDMMDGDSSSSWNGMGGMMGGGNSGGWSGMGGGMMGW